MNRPYKSPHRPPSAEVTRFNPINPQARNKPNLTPQTPKPRVNPVYPRRAPSPELTQYDPVDPQALD